MLKFNFVVLLLRSFFLLYLNTSYVKVQPIAFTKDIPGPGVFKYILC